MHAVLSRAVVNDVRSCLGGLEQESKVKMQEL